MFLIVDSAVICAAIVTTYLPSRFDRVSMNSTRRLDPNMIRNSGMVQELSRVTGMDEAAASKTLNTAFTMIGQRALQAAGQTTAKPAGKTLKDAASSGRKITR